MQNKLNNKSGFPTIQKENTSGNNPGKSYYPSVPASANFVKIEEEILAYWQENNIFQKSFSQRKPVQDGQNNEFIFYDGPPFANGLPHLGHLLTGFIKDTYARYQTSRGKRVERRFGWDCHGLPAELEAEKELGFSGRAAITEYGIDKYNDHCRKSVLKYTSLWEQYVTRQARWVDFKNSYKTMDKNYMESILWAFKELYNKGLIYESMRVMPYSWACETPLSNFETRLDNSYRTRVDKAITVRFKLINPPKLLYPFCTACYLLAWTTTPWTLPSNLAIAVNKDMDYSCIIRDNTCYVLASFAVNSYVKELGIKEADTNSFPIIKGMELINREYQPLFSYFQNHKNNYKNSFTILAGDFVTAGEGTGIVHIAPGFGEEDQLLCEQQGIDLVCPVDNAGKFTAEVTDFASLQVFVANDLIIKKLKESGNCIKVEQYTHNYPHCWRTDTPLIYKAVPCWYVKVTKIKDRMTELNKQINWIPDNVKEGLFGKWLENARDWAISRNRFWGTPIPIWQSDNPNYPRIDVYGSCGELEQDFKVKIENLHRPFIDSLTRPNPDDPTGKSIMRRVSDVFDCWFESGSMPYAQVHYPFENKAWFEKHLPADFIVEYVAQTRGWFYTLMVLSTALFDKPPFLNCICHGVILDIQGQKLSKRLNNYTDPLILFNNYGADALRITMLSANVVKGQELLIDKDGKMVFDSLRLVIKPIWNAYHFFCLYANIDRVKAVIIYQAEHILDLYILAKLRIAVEHIKAGMDNFDTQIAYNAIENFFETLNNWYIRRSRQRFWKSRNDNYSDDPGDADKITAYNVLYTCLQMMSKAGASLLPLIMEYIYLGLNAQNPDNIYQNQYNTCNKNDSETKNNQDFVINSVHLTDFPELTLIKAVPDLVKKMDQVRDICSTALFIRNQENIQVRQPLAGLKIITAKTEHKKQEYNNQEYNQEYNIRSSEEFISLIKDEINVKSVTYSDELTNYADFCLALNFPVLGKRLAKYMKEIIVAAKAENWHYENHKLTIAGHELFEEEYNLTLKLKKDSKGVKALPHNQGIIILDLNITPELRNEGTARNIVRLIQQARKDAGFEVEDRINLAIKSKYDLSAILAVYGDFIKEQTLSNLNDNEDFIPEFKTTSEIIVAEAKKEQITIEISKIRNR